MSKEPAIEVKWDKIYKSCDYSEPTAVLRENIFLLPQKGCALDLACGLGANALLLAEKGLEVHAWDVSSTALSRLQQRAKQQDLEIASKQIFVKADDLPANSFDVVVISRFLDRSLSTSISACLKKDGLLFYQTFSREKRDSIGPNNSDFLLARNELLTLFQHLKVVVYKENGLIGNLDCGERNEVLFVAQKC